MVERLLAPKTIRTNYGVLRAILSWAVDTDTLERSPCRGIHLPPSTRTDKRMASAADVERLADALPLDYRVAVFLGALGLRQAEVFGLRVGAVDFLRRKLTVRATVNEVEGRMVEGRIRPHGLGPRARARRARRPPGPYRSHRPRRPGAAGPRWWPGACDQFSPARLRPGGCAASASRASLSNGSATPPAI